MCLTTGCGHKVRSFSLVHAQPRAWGVHFYECALNVHGMGSSGGPSSSLRRGWIITNATPTCRQTLASAPSKGCAALPGFVVRQGWGGPAGARVPAILGGRTTLNMCVASGWYRLRQHGPIHPPPPFPPGAKPMCRGAAAKADNAMACEQVAKTT